MKSKNRHGRKPSKSDYTRIGRSISKDRRKCYQEIKDDRGTLMK